MNSFRPPVINCSTTATFSGRIQLGRTEYRIESVKEASSGSYHRHGHIDYGTYPQEYIPVLEDKMTGLHSIKLPPVYKEEYTVAHIPLGAFFSNVQNYFGVSC